MKRGVCVVTAVIVTLLASRAAADPPPPTRVTVPALCHDSADPPNDLALSPGMVILTEDAWANLDAKVKQLQEDRTRLTAENESFRESASTSGWVWVASAIAGAAAAGFAAGRLF